jgi:hypothetical protein
MGQRPCEILTWDQCQSQQLPAITKAVLIQFAFKLMVMTPARFGSQDTVLWG